MPTESKPFRKRGRPRLGGGRVNIPFGAPAEFANEFRRFCNDTGRALSTAIRTAVVEYMIRHKADDPSLRVDEIRALAEGVPIESAALRRHRNVKVNAPGKGRTITATLPERFVNIASRYCRNTGRNLNGLILVAVREFLVRNSAQDPTLRVEDLIEKPSEKTPTDGGNENGSES